jgi:hypothetical protein
MSTRAALLAGSGPDAIEFAEAVSWLPLLWLALPSSKDLGAAAASGLILTDRADAIQRCRESRAFLAGLFPEFEPLEDASADLLGALEAIKAVSVGIDVRDHVGLMPDVFVPALTAAVAAVEAREEGCRFTRPGGLFENPFTGVSEEVEAREYETTREVVILATSLDPCDVDEDLRHEQLVGMLF